MVGVFLSPHVFAVAWLACYHEEVFQRGCSVCTWTFLASEVLWIALMFTLLTSNENQFRREEMAPVLWSVKWRREEHFLISLRLRVDFRGLLTCQNACRVRLLTQKVFQRQSSAHRSGVFPPSPASQTHFRHRWAAACSLQLTNSSVGSFFYVMYLSYTYFFCFDTWMTHWITHKKILLKEYK